MSVGAVENEVNSIVFYSNLMGGFNGTVGTLVSSIFANSPNEMAFFLIVCGCANSLFIARWEC